MSGVPKVGQVVQVFGDDGGRDIIGEVLMDITERTLIVETPAGIKMAVKVKGTRFEVQGQDDDIPLPPEPDDR